MESVTSIPDSTCPEDGPPLELFMESLDMAKGRPTLRGGDLEPRLLTRYTRTAEDERSASPSDVMMQINNVKSVSDRDKKNAPTTTSDGEMDGDTCSVEYESFHAFSPGRYSCELLLEEINLPRKGGTIIWCLDLNIVVLC